ncbi:hypothetical protein ACNZ5P_001612 [Campylobacter jejuni]
MQERIKELELRYKYFLLKKYLKYLLLIILISVIAFCFFYKTALQIKVI